MNIYFIFLAMEHYIYVCRVEPFKEWKNTGFETLMPQSLYALDVKGLLHGMYKGGGSIFSAYK